MTHYGALTHKPSTFGAGQPLTGIRPYRRQIGNPVVMPPAEWLEIIDEACVRHRLHRKDILAGWKSVEAVACRNEIWAELRRRFGTSLTKIGMMTGGFHHTTVLHGIRCALRNVHSHKSESVQ